MAQTGYEPLLQYEHVIRRTGHNEGTLCKLYTSFWEHVWTTYGHDG